MRPAAPAGRRREIGPVGVGDVPQPVVLMMGTKSGRDRRQLAGDLKGLADDLGIAQNENGVGARRDRKQRGPRVASEAVAGER